MVEPRRFALIPAAGSSARFGGRVPKQYAQLAGAPVIVRTLQALLEWGALDRVFVVLAPGDTRFAQAWTDSPLVVPLNCGGATRSESVGNGLNAIASRVADHDWILVHDAARPCIDAALLARLADAIGDDPVGGLLAIPVSDTLKRAQAIDLADARVERTEDRHGLWCAQTPQMFRYALLRAALERARGSALTDDAQAVEALGMRPRLVRGSASNVKITYADDLALAEAWFAHRVAP